MSTTVIDSGSALGARTLQRLVEDQIVWLTTVSPTGKPAPTPVWFTWTGSQVIIASQPGTSKLKNISVNANIALHFNATNSGNDVQVINGACVHDFEGLTDAERADFDAKYTDSIAQLGMTPDSFHASYSAIIRATPSRLRGT